MIFNPVAGRRRQTPVRRFIAADGDGTINEIINGMIQGKNIDALPPNILALGTANVLARDLALPRRPDLGHRYGIALLRSRLHRSKGVRLATDHREVGRRSGPRRRRVGDPTAALFGDS
ncbi:MAG: hypothetical protein GDA41_09465 [Rhodospirillales bacterium]|nr:hypothetical protein [Rhodospirillales bacterium]